MSRRFMDRDSLTNIQNYLSADWWVKCLKCSIYILHIEMETDEESKYCLRTQFFLYFKYSHFKIRRLWKKITGVPSCNILTCRQKIEYFLYLYTWFPVSFLFLKYLVWLHLMTFLNIHLYLRLRLYRKKVEYFQL